MDEEELEEQGRELLSLLALLFSQSQFRVWLIGRPRLQDLLFRVRDRVEALPEGRMEATLAWRRQRLRILEDLDEMSGRLRELLGEQMQAQQEQVASIARRWRPAEDPPALTGEELLSRSRVLAISTDSMLERQEQTGRWSAYVLQIYTLLDRAVQGALLEDLEPRERGERIISGRVIVPRGRGPRPRSTAESATMARTQAIIAAALVSSIGERAVAAWARAGYRGPWVWITREDEMVCPNCKPLHLKRFPNLRAAPTWPLHPWCRCALLPVYPRNREGMI